MSVAVTVANPIHEDESIEGTESEAERDAEVLREMAAVAARIVLPECVQNGLESEHYVASIHKAHVLAKDIMVRAPSSPCFTDLFTVECAWAAAWAAACSSCQHPAVAAEQH